MYIIMHVQCTLFGLVNMYLPLQFFILFYFISFVPSFSQSVNKSVRQSIRLSISQSYFVIFDLSWQRDGERQKSLTYGLKIQSRMLGLHRVPLALVSNGWRLFTQDFQSTCFLVCYYFIINVVELYC